MKNGIHIDEEGNKFWYKNGEFHREDGPAIEYNHGNHCWYKNGKLHREDGPAIQSEVSKSWHKNGQLHREDGPALEYYYNNEWRGDNHYIKGIYIKIEKDIPDHVIKWKLKQISKRMQVS